MPTKTCSRCGAQKELDEFYVQSGRPTAACKCCIRLSVLEYRYENLESVRAYDRRRNKTRKRVGRIIDLKKYNANGSLSRAVRHGKLARKPCVICGAEYAEGHHHDYDRPLDVIWLCPPHHRQLHCGKFSLIPNF